MDSSFSHKKDLTQKKLNFTALEYITQSVWVGQMNIKQTIEAITYFLFLS